MMGYGIGFAGGGGFAGLFWGLCGILLMVGVVILIVWLVSRLVPQQTAQGPIHPDPLDLLRARFARGEIAEAEFTQAKHVLGYDR